VSIDEKKRIYKSFVDRYQKVRLISDPDYQTRIVPVNYLLMYNVEYDTSRYKNKRNMTLRYMCTTYI